MDALLAGLSNEEDEESTEEVGYMSHSPKSFKGGYAGDSIGEYDWGYTRSLVQIIDIIPIYYRSFHFLFHYPCFPI